MHAKVLVDEQLCGSEHQIPVDASKGLGLDSRGTVTTGAE